MGGFQQFLKKVKHLGDTTILSEISQVRSFLASSISNPLKNLMSPKSVPRTYAIILLEK